MQQVTTIDDGGFGGMNRGQNPRRIQGQGVWVQNEYRYTTGVSGVRRGFVHSKVAKKDYAVVGMWSFRVPEGKPVLLIQDGPQLQGYSDATLLPVLDPPPDVLVWNDPLATLTATAGDEEVALAWTYQSPISAWTLGCKIKRHTSAFTSFNHPDAVLVGTFTPSQTSYTDTGLTNGTTYYYTGWTYSDNALW